MLPNSAPTGKKWTYTVSQPGIIQEGTPDDLASDYPKISDQLIPGPHTPFVFKGVKPGAAMLYFTYADLDGSNVTDSAKFKIRVFPDNTLYIVGFSAKNF